MNASYAKIENTTVGSAMRKLFYVRTLLVMLTNIHMLQWEAGLKN